MILIRGATETSRTKLSAIVLLFAFLITSSLSSYAGSKTNDTTTNHNQQESKKQEMKTILIIGMNPHTIDYTSPELPQGLNAAIIEQGLKAALEKLNAIGYEAETFLINTGNTDLGDLATQLKDKNYDGVVVGNGIRSLASNFILFEQIINVVHKNAPGSIIIFNTLPTNTDEAVKRWL